MSKGNSFAVLKVDNRICLAWKLREPTDVIVILKIPSSEQHMPASGIYLVIQPGNVGVIAQRHRALKSISGRVRSVSHCGVVRRRIPLECLENSRALPEMCGIDIPDLTCIQLSK